MSVNESMIFIVDDDQVQNEIHSIIIKKLYPGFQIRTFTHVSEAVKELLNYHMPDILFLDLHMPGDDIVSLLDVQKSSDMDFDVYLISSLAHMNDLSILKKYPKIKGFIPKPLQEHKLRTIIGHFA